MILFKMINPEYVYLQSQQAIGVGGRGRMVWVFWDDKTILKLERGGDCITL